MSTQSPTEVAVKLLAERVSELDLEIAIADQPDNDILPDTFGDDWRCSHR